MRKVVNLFRHYVLRRIDGDPSPATYWSLREPPTVKDRESLTQYLSPPVPPPYLIDYRAKLAYELADRDGIIVLNYGGKLGRQINPEAAFQYALGLHDRFLTNRAESDRERFLHYARYFLAARDDRGRWPYHFDWYECHAPWFSALAQSRGASVMIRAWQLTSDDAFKTAAVEAIAEFGTRIDKGGFRAAHPGNRAWYLEEYPDQPTAVLNGFMAALFGLYEVSQWLDDRQARLWFNEYLDSLESILPLHTLQWWTVYDFDPDSPIVNIHSPRYHRLVTDYLAVLATVTGRSTLAEVHKRFMKFDSISNRARASTLKAAKKVLHR